MTTSLSGPVTASSAPPACLPYLPPLPGAPRPAPGAAAPYFTLILPSVPLQTDLQHLYELRAGVCTSALFMFVYRRVGAFICVLAPLSGIASGVLRACCGRNGDAAECVWAAA